MELSFLFIEPRGDLFKFNIWPHRFLLAIELNLKIIAVIIDYYPQME